MLFWVASYPRSGNGFFRELLSRVCHVSSTEIETCPGLLRELLGERALQVLQQVRRRQAERFGGSAAPPGIPDPQAALRAPPSAGPDWADRPLSAVIADLRPFAIKSHCLLHDADLPAVYLVRDGRDAMVSYARFTPHYGASIPVEVFRANLIERINYQGGRFGNWSQNVESWVNRPRTCVLRFEDLIREPMQSLQRAIDELRLPIQIHNGNVPTFAELQAAYPDIFRRGRIGSWRDEFPADLLPLFWEKHGTAMRRLGYSDRAAA
jgi:hypothetical protein